MLASADLHMPGGSGLMQPQLSAGSLYTTVDGQLIQSQPQHSIYGAPKLVQVNSQTQLVQGIGPSGQPVVFAVNRGPAVNTQRVNLQQLQTVQALPLRQATLVKPQHLQTVHQVPAYVQPGQQLQLVQVQGAGPQQVVQVQGAPRIITGTSGGARALVPVNSAGTLQQVGTLQQNASGAGVAVRPVGASGTMYTVPMVRGVPKLGTVSTYNPATGVQRVMQAGQVVHVVSGNQVQRLVPAGIVQQGVNGTVMTQPAVTIQQQQRAAPSVVLSRQNLLADLRARIAAMNTNNAARPAAPMLGGQLAAQPQFMLDQHQAQLLPHQPRNTVVKLPAVAAQNLLVNNMQQQLDLSGLHSGLSRDNSDLTYVSVTGEQLAALHLNQQLRQQQQEQNALNSMSLPVSLENLQLGGSKPSSQSGPLGLSMLSDSPVQRPDSTPPLGMHLDLMDAGVMGMNGDAQPGKDRAAAKQDLKTILGCIGVELARHGISVESAVSAGWLGTLASDDVHILAQAYADELRRMQTGAAAEGGASTGAASMGSMPGSNSNPGSAANSFLMPAVVSGADAVDDQFSAFGYSFFGDSLNMDNPLLQPLEGCGESANNSSLLTPKAVGSFPSSINGNSTGPSCGSSTAAGSEDGAGSRHSPSLGNGSLMPNPGNGEAKHAGWENKNASLMGTAAESAGSPNNNELAARFANLDLGCGFF